jgi:uncharacterized protein YjbJ (UPF0337 family)
MGLFDIVREKASELLGGASEKVSELTGTELPGKDAAEELTQSADNVTGDVAGNVTEAAQGVGETATGAAQDVTDAATETVNDATEPYRP